MTQPLKVVDMFITGAFVAAFLGSFIGVTNYRMDEPVPRTWIVTWNTSGITTQEQAGALTTGPSPQSGTFALTSHNLTKVKIQVSVETNGPRLMDTTYNIAFSTPANVSMPGGQTLTIPRGSAKASLEKESNLFAQVPEVREVTALNLSAAQASLAKHESTTGVGAWTVTATLTNPTPGLGNDFTLEVKPTGSRYSAELNLKTRSG